MTTTQTPLKAGIINALAAAKLSQAGAARALGITPRTFGTKLESDGFTMQQLITLSQRTGVKMSTILEGVMADAKTDAA